MSDRPYQTLYEDHDGDILSAIVMDREWMIREVDYLLWITDDVDMDRIEVFWNTPDLRPLLHTEVADRVLAYLNEFSSEWTDYIEAAGDAIHATASTHVSVAVTEMLSDEQTRIEIFAKVKARQVEQEQARTSKPQFPIAILNERTGLIAEPLAVVACRE